MMVGQTLQQRVHGVLIARSSRCMQLMPLNEGFRLQHSLTFEAKYFANTLNLQTLRVMHSQYQLPWGST